MSTPRFVRGAIVVACLVGVGLWLWAGSGTVSEVPEVAGAGEAPQDPSLRRRPGSTAARAPRARASVEGTRPPGVDAGAGPSEAEFAARTQAERELRRERREASREARNEIREQKRADKEARILESVRGDAEATASWEARFEERRRKRAEKEARRTPEAREARSARARARAEQRAGGAPPPGLPILEGPPVVPAAQ